MSSFLLPMVYFLLGEYCETMGVGKRIMKIELVSEGLKLTFSKKLIHSILKWIAALIWPIAIVYYMVRNKMIYGKVLKIRVRDKMREETKD